MIVALLLLVAVPMMAERVSPETARKVATTFLNNNGAKATQLTDLSKEAGFPNLYIFNGEEGFVVMSADNCVKPILGYSFTGKFVVEGMPENVRGWLQGYNDEIQYAVENQLRASVETIQLWKDLQNGKAGIGKAATIVSPIIQTQWDQGSPYYNLCPTIGNRRTYTGCVATAMAQIMKFWEHPTIGSGSHSYTWNNQTLTANFGNTTYDWANMTNTYSSSSSSTENTAVATLMFHCGVSIEMNYGTSGSSASTAAVVTALQTYFGYSTGSRYLNKESYSDASWIAMLKGELDDDRPIQYRGSDAGGLGGHSFVCDGYDSNDNFHFNWGWGGYCDGYYALDDMEPGVGGIGAGAGIYTVGQGAIFGIEPISSLTAPTLTATTSEGAAILTWNSVQDATSYIIYKDNLKIAEGVTSTTYTDGNLSFGVDYEYYVRAVSGQTKSNPSNTVTVNSNYRDLTPSNLNVAFNNGSASLSWEGYPGGASTDLHYGINYANAYYGYSGDYDTYWGQKYLASSMANFQGMYINKVAFYAAFTGNYSLYLYKNNTTSISNQLWSQSFTVSETGWNEIVISSPTPISLDVSNDLWVVLYASSSIALPATYSLYSGENVQHARYISTSLNSWDNVNDNISWCIRTYLTDGTYTYNLYDNGTIVASDISGSSYNVANPASNTVHQYTVKTHFDNGESAPSNMADLALGNATLASLSLGTNDHMTVTEGSTLTVSGTLSNSVNANLILEDGAQLVSGPVNGTMLMDIDGYTNTNNDHEGYYLIASPVDGIQPGNVTNMTNGTYDLYAFDANETLEWRNFEAQGSFTTLDAGVGYLYANLATTTLEFAGQLNASFQGISLDYTANDDFHSLNLVGNPYAHQAEFSILNDGSWVSEPNYLTLNAAGDGFISNTFLNGKIVLNPMQAVLVQATAAGESFEEYSDIIPIDDGPEIPFDAVRGTVNIQVLNSDGIMADNAIVRFDEGGMMRKLYLSNSSTRIYIPRGNNEMAIVRSDNESELPVNFKASSNGTYTLNVDNESLGLEYLHLIDNLTGVETDLLETPRYTFEAKTTDYASRFRLVFSDGEDGASTSSATFAYVNNGNIVVNEEGTLQIVDMTGRVIVSRSGRIQCVATAGMTPGVYVLRLITADGVKTQKIVIE